MTQLRDARLKQALAHAPDAHMAPDARTRAAIKAMAIQAAAPAAVPGQALPRWRRLLGAPGSPSSRMPWNAAFATILLASLVTFIWRDEEIPGAQSADPPMASAPKESAAKAVTPQAEPSQPAKPAIAAPPPASIPAPAAAPAAPRPAERARAVEPRADALVKKAEVETAENQGKSAADAPERAQREAQRPALRDEPATAQAVPPPAAPPDMARMAPPAPAPAAPAAAMPSRQRETQSMAGSTRSAGAAPGSSIAADAARSNFGATDDAVFQGWTHARLTYQGRTIVVSRAQTGDLAAQVRAIALAVTGRKEPTGPAVLQVELLEDGVVTGALAVGAATARWTHQRPGFEQDSSGAVDAERVRQLIAEAGRAMSR